MAERYDAVIIGAGIIGAAIGFELAKRGRRPLNIDMLPAAGYGSTSNSCAIIRVHYSTVEGTALAYESYFRWRDWPTYLGADDERGLAVFRETGCLVMRTEENGNLDRVVANVEELGIPWQEWDGDTIRARLPGYDLQRFAPAKCMDEPGFGEPTGGEVAAGVFFPTAGYVSDPQLATHNLQRAAEARGGAFRFGDRVVEILVDCNRVQGVVLDDGTRIEAPVVVNVAGPHSSKVNALVGTEQDMRISTRALRQEVVHLPAPAEMDFEGSGFVVSDSDIGIYCRPEIGNHILIGSEDPPCDPHDWVDPDDFDRNFTDQWTVQAHRMAQRLPTLGVTAPTAGVVDLYDVTEDWGPVYDRAAVDGFYMAIGTSGNQFKNAPVVGEMMAALIDHCEAGGDHDAQPLQFQLATMNRTLDMGAFSRRREINENSSFSVLG